ncbi:hypothetical protein ACGFZR_15180 [Streptomyces sp. NPDC048241]|uniref:hypothetical protein n=1 Tax=Streptomyces sp. NPDC048241 TaxID=3365521 RepID=UPI003718BE40
MVDTEKLEAVAREELVCLWGDLNEARMYAINGKWSIKCDQLEERIKDLTRLIGPIPWEEIQLSLLELGIYQRVHAELGIDTAEVRPDMAKVAEVRARH